MLTVASGANGGLTPYRHADSHGKNSAKGNRGVRTLPLGAISLAIILVMAEKHIRSREIPQPHDLGIISLDASHRNHKTASKLAVPCDKYGTVEAEATGFGSAAQNPLGLSRRMAATQQSRCRRLPRAYA